MHFLHLANDQALVHKKPSHENYIFFSNVTGMCLNSPALTLGLRNNRLASTTTCVVYTWPSKHASEKSILMKTFTVYNFFKYLSILAVIYIFLRIFFTSQSTEVKKLL